MQDLRDVGKEHNFPKIYKARDVLSRGLLWSEKLQ